MTTDTANNSNLSANPFQVFTIRLIHHVLNDELFRSHYNEQGFKKILLFIVRHYPEIAPDGKTTYQNIESYKKYYKFTEKALEALDAYVCDKAHKSVSFEHIIPNKVLMDNLLSLGENPSIDMITSVMEESEVIIMSPEETNTLNQKGLRSSGNKDERINVSGAVIAESTKGNNIRNK